MAPKRVLLCGTSANPPTGMQGHMGMIYHCRSMYDEIWMLPVYQHSFTTKRNLVSFDHRLAMCELAIQDTLKAYEHQDQGAAEAARAAAAVVLAKTTERDVFEVMARGLDETAIQSLRIGTIDLMLFLRETSPDVQFTMVLGSDTFVDLCAGKWKRGDELVRMLEFLVVHRQGYEDCTPCLDAPGSLVPRDRVRFVRFVSLTDITSSYIRTVTSEEELRSLVTPSVAQYIVDHQLYGFASEKQ